MNLQTIPIERLRAFADAVLHLRAAQKALAIDPGDRIIRGRVLMREQLVDAILNEFLINQNLALFDPHAEEGGAL